MKPLVVPATLEALNAIRDYVIQAARAAALDEKATYRLSLAVDEIATNIVTHGYGANGHGGAVSVWAQQTPQTLRITLEDGGPPFDPRDLGRPAQLDQPIETRPIGGLGVYLTLRNVDEFEYEYVNKRNRNIFIMRRAA